MNLVSSIGGHDAARYFDKSNLQKAAVIDFDLNGLPSECDQATIKQVANVKHVISADVSHDNFTGACKGDARIKVRLNEGETEDMIK